MRRPCRRPAVGHGVLELVRELGAVDQEFLGHAAPDHAGAAHPVVFTNADARTMAGRDARGPHAARAGADYEEVVVISHLDNLKTDSNTAAIGSLGALYMRCGGVKLRHFSALCRCGEGRPTSSVTLGFAI